MLDEVFVGGLPSGTTAKDVWTYFNLIAPVDKVYLSLVPHTKHAFVHFKQRLPAHTILARNHAIDGEGVDVLKPEHAEIYEGRNKEGVFVRGMPPTQDVSEVWSEFVKYGRIRRMQVALPTGTTTTYHRRPAVGEEHPLHLGFMFIVFQLPRIPDCFSQPCQLAIKNNIVYCRPVRPCDEVVRYECMSILSKEYGKFTFDRSHDEHTSTYPLLQENTRSMNENVLVVIPTEPPANGLISGTETNNMSVGHSTPYNYSEQHLADRQSDANQPLTGSFSGISERTVNSSGSIGAPIYTRRYPAYQPSNVQMSLYPNGDDYQVDWLVENPWLSSVLETKTFSTSSALTSHRPIPARRPKIIKQITDRVISDYNASVISHIHSARNYDSDEECDRIARAVRSLIVQPRTSILTSRADAEAPSKVVPVPVNSQTTLNDVSSSITSGLYTTPRLLLENPLIEQYQAPDSNTHDNITLKPASMESEKDISSESTPIDAIHQTEIIVQHSEESEPANTVEYVTTSSPESTSATSMAQITSSSTAVVVNPATTTIRTVIASGSVEMNDHAQLPQTNNHDNTPGILSPESSETQQQTPSSNPELLANYFIDNRVDRMRNCTCLLQPTQTVPFFPHPPPLPLLPPPTMDVFQPGLAYRQPHPMMHMMMPTALRHPFQPPQGAIHLNGPSHHCMLTSLPARGVPYFYMPPPNQNPQ